MTCFKPRKPRSRGGYPGLQRALSLLARVWLDTGGMNALFNDTFEVIAEDAMARRFLGPPRTTVGFMTESEVPDGQIVEPQ